MKWITALLVTVLGMWGGQRDKWVRRFGIPIVAVASLMGQKKPKYLIYLLWIPILSMGYGVDSHLFSFCGKIEWLTRLAYASLLALPFALNGPRRLVLSLVAMVVAFQVRAGSLGQIFGYDILIEDIVRYGVMGALLLLNNLPKRIDK